MAEALTSIGMKVSGRQAPPPPPPSSEAELGNDRDEEPGTTTPEALRNRNTSCPASFDLVIASDVIYSASVVEPLFETVGAFLLLPTAETDEVQQPPREGRQEGSQSGNVHRDEEEQGQPALASLPLGSSSSSAAEEAAAGRSGDDAIVVEVSAETEDSGLPPPPPPPPHTTTQGGRNDHPTHTPSRLLLEEGGSGEPRCTTTAENSRRRYFPMPTCANAAVAAPAPVFVMSQSFVYGPETEEAIARACERHGLLRKVVWDELHRGGGGGGAESLEEVSRLKSGATRNDGDEDNRADGGAGNSSGSGAIGREDGRGANSADAEGETAEERGASQENDNANHLASGGNSDDGGAEGMVQRAGTKLQLFWRA